MIDIEKDVYQTVKSNLPSFVTCKQYYQNVERKFPLVTVEEIGNSMYEDFIDSSLEEKMTQVSYEVNVYSNSATKKEDCKRIMGTVDEIMFGMGFIRIMCSPVPNQDDSKVFRYSARYRAVVDKNHVIYRR